MIGETTPSASIEATIGSEPPVAATSIAPKAQDADPPQEVGGRDGLEPTRYGDWEKNGRCIDF
jgi:hypothetical protein